VIFENPARVLFGRNAFGQRSRLERHDLFV
jgi:hypothetical protein